MKSELPPGNEPSSKSAEADQAQILTSVNHALRTPVSTILSMIGMALEKVTDPTAHDCLQNAKGSADLLLALLNDLLDSARIESGNLVMAITGQDMIDLVERLACDVRPAPQAATPSTAHSPALATNAVFDVAAALSRCFHSTALVREMIECFFEEVENLFPQMRAAVEINDFVKAGRLGHRLKGTLAYLGAESAKEAALRVERFYKSGGGTRIEVAEAIDALEHECLALEAALRGHPFLVEPSPDDGGL
jgi:HPt (histidine-containing phosphotransfer) domain-containing protein